MIHRGRNGRSKKRTGQGTSGQRSEEHQRNGQIDGEMEKLWEKWKKGTKFTVMDE